MNWNNTYLIILIPICLLFSFSLAPKSKNESQKFVFKNMQVNNGQAIYMAYCASCHGKKKRGITAPPLLNLKKKDSQLTEIIKNGLPATQMPAFNLSDKQIKDLISYIRKPEIVTWSITEAKGTLQTIRKDSPRPLYQITDLKNLTMMVEKGAGKIWVMQNEKIFDKVSFKNVHGGIKITDDSFYAPSRDGWVAKYNLEKGGFKKIRATINLRNICLIKDKIIVSSLLPQEVVFLDKNSLNPISKKSINGKITGVYKWKNDIALFTFKDKAKIGLIKGMEISYKDIDEPIEDFFIDPLKNYIIGSSRHGNLLKVIEIKTGKTVFEKKIQGFPHLSSSAYWFENGEFFFATPHIMSTIVSVWKMYDWSLVKEIEIGGSGFFVRSHPKTPYLWTDNGTDNIVLINKKTLALKNIVPSIGDRFIHTEFSGDGKIAYVSIYVDNGKLILYDAATLKELKRISANIPLGKYNYINKNKDYEAYLLGQEVFNAKCWGCHHQKRTAFGPSLLDIARKRTDAQIMAQILNPKLSAHALGYKESVMPKIKISGNEINFLIKYIRTLQALEKK